MQNNSQDPKIDIFLKNKLPEEKPVQEIINSFSQIIGDFKRDLNLTTNFVQLLYYLKQCA